MAVHRQRQRADQGKNVVVGSGTAIIKSISLTQSLVVRRSEAFFSSAHPYRLEALPQPAHSGCGGATWQQETTRFSEDSEWPTWAARKRCWKAKAGCSENSAILPFAAT